jgi:predicted transcriptional regulator
VYAASWSTTEALVLIRRCARDSVPPMRRQVFEDIVRHPGASLRERMKRLYPAREFAVHRELEALVCLRALDESGNEVRRTNAPCAEIRIEWDEAAKHEEGGDL